MLGSLRSRSSHGHAECTERRATAPQGRAAPLPLRCAYFARRLLARRVPFWPVTVSARVELRARVGFLGDFLGLAAFLMVFLGALFLGALFLAAGLAAARGMVDGVDQGLGSLFSISPLTLIFCGSQENEFAEKKNLVVKRLCQSSSKRNEH